METEENTVNNYEIEEPEPMKVSEPVVLYGSNCVLDLDETKRYTYADYLTCDESERKVPVRALKGLEIDLEELFGEFKNSHY